MKIVNKQPVYQGFSQLYKVTLEADGATLERELFDTGSAVAVLVFDTVKQQYIFVKQYRLAADTDVLEVVAGMHDHPNESFAEVARREVAEETGYAVDHLELIQSFFSSPGVFSEKVHLFYAEVSQKKSAGGGLVEEHENIQIVEVPAVNLAALAVEDGKTLIAVQWALLRKRQS